MLGRCTGQDGARILAHDEIPTAALDDAFGGRVVGDGDAERVALQEREHGDTGRAPADADRFICETMQGDHINRDNVDDARHPDGDHGETEEEREDAGNTTHSCFVAERRRASHARDRAVVQDVQRSSSSSTAGAAGSGTGGRLDRTTQRMKPSSKGLDTGEVSSVFSSAG